MRANPIDRRNCAIALALRHGTARFKLRGCHSVYALGWNNARVIEPMIAPSHLSSVAKKVVISERKPVKVENKHIGSCSHTIKCHIWYEQIGEPLLNEMNDLATISPVTDGNI